MESEVGSGENGALDNGMFWDELQMVISTPCDSEDLIDEVLRGYLDLTVRYKDEHLTSELDISRCSFKLFSSSLFAAHGDYVRRQLLYGLLQEDDLKTLHMISSFLLFDGRQNESTFLAMNEEGSFPRLLELLQRKHDDEDDADTAGLDRLLMDLLYEMSRVQRVKIEDLVLVDDEFIRGLFGIIENLSYDVNDPYHYPVIRVLLVLNEQFMISAHDPVDEPTNFLTNKVIKVLSMDGSLYKTFGENIILLINREAETSLQLLTLKLLYLLFTTPPTHEYFYTNDLHVLVDILIRNLLDLPEDSLALRHTYLRVLYPLLAHTQLRTPPHYKRDEIKRMLNILVHGQLLGDTDDDKIQHFEDVDETTKRLVFRCATVDWLRDPDPDPAQQTGASTSPTEQTQDQEQGEPGERHHHRKPSAIRRLGMHLEPASSSTLSVKEVASQHEKPGVITPSRTDAPSGVEFVDPAAANKAKKVKPEPPKTRRWRGRRNTNTDEQIPEDLPPPLPTAAAVVASTTARSEDRRNSNSSLAPPIPAHVQRSASNPPASSPGIGPAGSPTPSSPGLSPKPAVPPPRRSAHILADSAAKGQKPEPPRTRRWKALTRSQEQSHSHSQSQDNEHDTVSVEEAIKNVSL